MVYAVLTDCFPIYAKLAGPVQSPETVPLPKPTPDLDLPDPTPEKPPYAIPPHVLRAMVLTLARPAADAADAVWTAIVQGGLDQLDTLDPRDRRVNGLFSYLR